MIYPTKFLRRSLLTLTALAAGWTSAHAAVTVLYDASNITTGVGNGYNGANTSAVDFNDGFANYGFNDNSVGSSSFALADKFSLSSAATISTITFDVYSSSTYPNSPTSPITGAVLDIYSAAPASSNRSLLFSTTAIAATAWTGVYRVVDSNLTNATMPVFSVTMSLAGLSLPAGNNYWAAWAVTGVSAPGSTSSLYSPPRMNADGTTPNGLAEFTASGIGSYTWGREIDPGPAASGVNFPLLVTGTMVPEPTSAALIALAGTVAGAAAWRRRRCTVV